MAIEIGTKSNYLTFAGYTKKNGKNMCLCYCDCGKSVVVTKQKFLSGMAKSCGCMKTNAMLKYSKYIGTTFSSWNILYIHMKKHICYAYCRCVCGTERDVNIYNLINGKSHDCGCGRKSSLSNLFSKNIIGLRFGKLVVENNIGTDKNKRRVYQCRCDCGNTISVSSSLLLNGHTTSCGCILSYYNYYINKYLDELNIEHICEFPIHIDNKRLRFDFFIPKYKMAIEYDGQQHYMPVNFGQNDTNAILENFKKIQQYDKLKDVYCSQNNITMIRIPYWKKENIKDIINNHLQRLNERDTDKQCMQQSELRP